MTYTTIAVIYNPNSTGSSKDLAKDFVKKLRARMPKQKVELIATEYAGHAEELAYTISKSSKNALVVSSSGDGGYNEVVNGAMRAQQEGYKVTTSLLPAGNANDHYRNLNKKDLVDLIIADEAKHIDLLKIISTYDGKPLIRYAHSYMGVGLTSEVSKELNKTKLNIFNEVWLVARALFVVKSVRLKIDGKIGHYESIIFSNVDEMSKYLKISRPSRINDGKFEVTIFKRRHKLKLILLLLKASFLGVEEDAQVSEYSFETIHETSAQADGEVISIDAGVRAGVTIEKQALRCIV